MARENPSVSDAENPSHHRLKGAHPRREPQLHASSAGTALRSASYNAQEAPAEITFDICLSRLLPNKVNRDANWAKLRAAQDLESTLAGVTADASIPRSSQ